MKPMFVLAGAFVMMAGATTAHAKCGTPSWVGTPSGAKIPAKGTLYAYREDLTSYPLNDQAVKARWTEADGKGRGADGGQKWSERRISDTVVAIDYDAGGATEVVVGEDHGAATLAIDPRWKAPAAAPHVVQYWHHAMSWTCSSADSVMMQIDQKTAAFRVRWKFAGKKTREWIVPARSSDDHLTVLELGKINCGGTTIDPTELAQGGELALTAIRFDGTEVAVEGLPPVLSAKQMPTTDEGVERALTLATVTPGEPDKPLEPPMDKRWPAMLFGLATLIVGGLFFTRHKTRALKTVV